MYRIGIDLGGTNIAVGVVDDGHAIVSRVSVPTMASRPAAEVVRDMGGAVEQVLARAGVSVADCRSMGVGSPGTCNSADGVVERAYNLGWDHVPVCRMLEQRFGIPCRLSNDANCAALAEQVAGAAVGHDNVVLVTLGTGVGGGIIIGGRIYDGMRGAGAELGHTLLVMDGEPCTCGRRGCWGLSGTALISSGGGPALIRQACQAAARHPRLSAWRPAGGGHSHRRRHQEDGVRRSGPGRRGCSRYRPGEAGQRGRYHRRSRAVSRKAYSMDAPVGRQHSCLAAGAQLI